MVDNATRNRRIDDRFNLWFNKFLLVTVAFLIGVVGYFVKGFDERQQANTKTLNEIQQRLVAVETTRVSYDCYDNRIYIPNVRDASQ